jgi:hypothetical protein
MNRPGQRLVREMAARIVAAAWLMGELKPLPSKSGTSTPSQSRRGR